MGLETTNDYRTLLLNNTPLMDVRAPVEFVRGALPNAYNAPLMNDRERELVGTCYKQKGQQAAIALGHELVAGKVRDERMEQWLAFTQQHPEGVLYCFRGGLRSATVQQWLQDVGVKYTRIHGGYKAVRQYLLDINEQAATEKPLLLLGGMTGIGKTEILERLDHAIDLEGLANHRGSSFGRQVSDQPAQINFENALAMAFLRGEDKGLGAYVLEDESRLIGSCSLPLSLYQRMQQIPLIWLEDTLENRIQRIRRTYVEELCADFLERDPEQGFTDFAQRLRQSLDRIQRRLGGERHQRLAVLMDNALQQQQQGLGVSAHESWIHALLTEYYDPMYVYQQSLKAERIEFRGHPAEVEAYLRNRLEQISWSQS